MSVRNVQKLKGYYILYTINCLLCVIYLFD
uniref:Uncharacterized protein n=1 Tax=Anguilla anguilla TaxID=7936 RepID=A0A0E9Q3Z9_ANGAN